MGYQELMENHPPPALPRRSLWLPTDSPSSQVPELHFLCKTVVVMVMVKTPLHIHTCLFTANYSPLIFKNYETRIKITPGHFQMAFPKLEININKLNIYNGTEYHWAPTARRTVKPVLLTCEVSLLLPQGTLDNNPETFLVVTQGDRVWRGTPTGT